MDERAIFVQERMHAEFARWLYLVALTGAVVILAFSALDVVAYPALARRFFVYRLAAAACLTLTAVVAAKVRDHRAHLLLGLLAVGISAATIETMILQTGGHASRLSTGMVVLIVGVLAFIPWSMLLFAIVAVSIIGIYTLPIVATEPALDFTTFFLEVFFLSSVVLVMLPLRYVALRNFRELGTALYEVRACCDFRLHDGEMAAEDPIAVIRRLPDEIAARKSAEKLLETSEKKYRMLYESAPDGLCISDLEGNFTDWNRNAEEISGYRREEAIGKNFMSLNLLPLSLVPKVMQLFAFNAQGRPAGPDEFELIAKGGGRVPVEISTYPVSIDGKRMVLMTTRDITERKQAEEKLQESEKRYRLLFNSGNDPIVVHRPPGVSSNFIEANDLASQRLGYSREELLRLSPADIEDPADPFDVTTLGDAIRRDKQVLFEKTYLTRDGRKIPVEINARLFDWNGEPAVLSVVRDITERKRAEEKLREKQAMLQTLIQAIPDVVFFKDAQNRYLMVNKAAEEFMGLSQGQVLGKIDGELLPPELARACRVSDEMVATSLKAVRFEEQYTRAGQKVFFDTIKAPVFDDRGTFTGFIGVSREVTERKRVEEDLCRSREDIQRLNLELEDRVRERTEQLKVISRRLIQVQEEERRHLARELHDEVGQVLTGVKYGVEHLIAELPDSRKDEGLGVAASIGELLNSVRGLSLKLRPSMLDDFGLVPALKWDFGRVEATTGLRISFHCQGEQRRCDQHVEIALYRIAQEAITNVVRHAGVQEATVGLSLGEEEAVMTVEDHGTGFLTESWNIGQDSTGLSGMSERSMLLGGRFSVDSKPGEGTRVTAVIPLHA